MKQTAIHEPWQDSYTNHKGEFMVTSILGKQGGKENVGRDCIIRIWNHQVLTTSPEELNHLTDEAISTVWWFFKITNQHCWLYCILGITKSLKIMGFRCHPHPPTHTYTHKKKKKNYRYLGQVWHSASFDYPTVYTGIRVPHLNLSTSYLLSENKSET